MERKLVSIQVIEDIAPIAGADNIMQARVMGWTVVVKKGEFRPGDRCVFFEIDSVLPDGPAWAEFMRPRGFRVRTLKLRGVLSQGLALPVAILGGDVPEMTIGADELERGGRTIESLGAAGARSNAMRCGGSIDLRDRLGVTKYEPVLPDAREVAGPFPGRVPKTDEIRLQSALGVLDEMRGREFYVTTKLDGSSATYFRDADAGLLACSRNWALAPGENNVWRLAAQYELATRLPPDFAIQGEVCGPGIQKNRIGLPGIDLFVFSVYDVRGARFLDYEPFVAFCAEHRLRTVPIERVVRGDAAAAYRHDLDGWLEAARGLYAGTKQRKEGIVVRPLVEAPSATLGGRLSFKVINNDFLLKDED